MIVDILFTLGMLAFMGSSLTQLSKVLHTHKTQGISLKHYKLKFIAVVLMTAGYILSSLPISIVVSIVEGIITSMLILSIVKYRRLE